MCMGSLWGWSRHACVIKIDDKDLLVRTCLGIGGYADGFAVGTVRVRGSWNELLGITEVREQCFG